MSRRVAYAAVAVLGPLLLAESALRLHRPRDFQERAMVEKVEGRIAKAWASGIRAPVNVCYPPYGAIFSNRGSDDPKRIDWILGLSKLPPRRRWRIRDFFRAPEESRDTFFSVTSNSLGFRGPERTARKPAGVFRIVVLGSYAAFGYGVDDGDSYAAVLEKRLNERKPGGRRYEVWNGGRPGITAISGWALLSREVMRYSPDLVIWDFGWADLFTNDLVAGSGRRGEPRGPGWRRWLRNPGRGGVCSRRPFSSLQLCKAYKKRFPDQPREAKLAEFLEVNRRMIEFTKSRRLPVILLRHRVAVGSAQFRLLADPSAGIHHIDMDDVWRTARADPEDVEEFWSRSTWLDEIDVTREQAGADPRWIFRSDALHYNRLGHRMIADALYEAVVRPRPGA